MSTLKADTIVASDGTSPVTLTKQSAAKAWANFDGDAGTVAARNSLNVSGFTDNGTGDYTVSFSNSMSAADYSASYCHDNRSSFISGAQVDELAAGSFKARAGINGSAVDADESCVSVLGDLA
jgi:hypothetical protein